MREYTIYRRLTTLVQPGEQVLVVGQGVPGVFLLYFDRPYVRVMTVPEIQAVVARSRVAYGLIFKTQLTAEEQVNLVNYLSRNFETGTISLGMEGPAMLVDMVPGSIRAKTGKTVVAYASELDNLPVYQDSWATRIDVQMREVQRSVELVLGIRDPNWGK